MVDWGLKIPIVQTIQPRWNFKKANWEKFSKELDLIIKWIPPDIGAFDPFTNAIISVAKKNIPRGFRKDYVPGWSEYCEEIFEEFNNTGDPELEKELINALNENKREKWRTKTENLDFTHSSRKAWSLIRRLDSGKIPTPKYNAVSPNKVASHLLSMSNTDSIRSWTKYAKKKLKKVKKPLSNDSYLSVEFSASELDFTLSSVKNNKSPGFDGIFPEFLINMSQRVYFQSL